MGGGQRLAFVATNSITQGEQVAQLWPILFDRCGLEIAFAHRTFAWESEARGKAHVHVVVLGLTRAEDEPKEKRLFSYDDLRADPVESHHGALSPYLFDASRLADRHLVVEESSKPISDAPKVRMGSKLVDGGNYLFTSDEKAAFIAEEPKAAPLFRPIIGSLEYINGIDRWILFTDGVDPELIRAMPKVAERVAAVKKFRLASKKQKTRELADYPTRFEVTTVPTKPFLVIPEVSSERRDYVPTGWIAPPTVPSNLVHTMPDADLFHFGILTSKMPMAWLRNIGGRLESRYRYSIGIVYNTFPWPEADAAQKQEIRELAQAVLDARAAHPGATLADLYDPDLMPADLRHAHRDLDAAVDRLYRREPFDSDRARVEHLFGLYEKLAAPLLAASRAKRGRQRRKPSAGEGAGGP